MQVDIVTYRMHPRLGWFVFQTTEPCVSRLDVCINRSTDLSVRDCWWCRILSSACTLAHIEHVVQITINRRLCLCPNSRERDENGSCFDAGRMDSKLTQQCPSHAYRFHACSYDYWIYFVCAVFCSDLLFIVYTIRALTTNTDERCGWMPCRAKANHTNEKKNTQTT